MCSYLFEEIQFDPFVAYQMTILIVCVALCAFVCLCTHAIDTLLRKIQFYILSDQNECHTNWTIDVVLSNDSMHIVG